MTINLTSRAIFAHHLECLQDNAQPPFHVNSGEEATRCVDYMSSLARMHNYFPGGGASRAPRNRSMPVDGVVLIHYSRAPCRLKRMLAMMRRVGLPSRRGAQLQIAEHLDREDLSIGLMRRCVSCRLLMPYGRLDPVQFFDLMTMASGTANHIYGYHLAAHMGWETTLVLEDDAVLSDDFLRTLRQRMASLPPGWTIYNFGCNPSSSVRFAPRRFMSGSFVCARGYVLSRAGLDFFVRRASIAKRGADWMVWGVSALTERKEQPHTTWQGGIWVDEGSLSQSNRAKKLARGTDLCEDRPDARSLDARARADAPPRAG